MVPEAEVEMNNDIVSCFSDRRRMTQAKFHTNFPNYGSFAQFCCARQEQQLSKSDSILPVTVRQKSSNHVVPACTIQGPENWSELNGMSMKAVKPVCER